MNPGFFFLCRSAGIFICEYTNFVASLQTITLRRIFHLRRVFQITPDYCRGILEAEAASRVVVSGFAAALVTTLGLSSGVLVLGFRLLVG